MFHVLFDPRIYTYLADSRDSRVNVLAAVDVLDCRLAKEKENPVSDVEGANEVWF